MDIFRSRISFSLMSILAVLPLKPGLAVWYDWWTYAGFSGPSRWGIINENWSICNKGKYQSPIDISPMDLLFDPGLKHLHITGNKVATVIKNTGRDITIFVNETGSRGLNISMGPLSYTYRVYQIKIHFGRENGKGTEHYIDGKQFDAEIQLMAYNIELLKNYKMAEQSPKGLAILSVFAKVLKNATHYEFEKIIKNAEYLQFRDDAVNVNNLYLQNLIPNSRQYLTYEGSMTQPGCNETVTWIILNKPIYIGELQISALRSFRQEGPDSPLAFMSDNIRPLQPLNRRTVRTNINLGTGCNMEREIRYTVNKKMMDN